MWLLLKQRRHETPVERLVTRCSGVKGGKMVESSWTIMNAWEERLGIMGTDRRLVNSQPRGLHSLHAPCVVFEPDFAFELTST